MTLLNTVLNDTQITQQQVDRITQLVTNSDELIIPVGAFQRICHSLTREETKQVIKATFPLLMWNKVDGVMNIEMNAKYKKQYLSEI